MSERTKRAHGSGSIRMKRGKWQVRVMIDGQTHYQTLDPDEYTRLQAEKWASDWEKELRDSGEAWLGDQERVRTMTGLLEWFEQGPLQDRRPSTRRSYEESLRVFRAYWTGARGRVDPKRMKSSEVKSFLRWRQTHGPKGAKPDGVIVSDRTRAKDRTVLHTIFSDAIDEDLLTSNPVTRKTRVEKTRKGAKAFFTKSEYRLLTDDEYDALVAKAYDEHPMFGLYILVLGEAGPRAIKEAVPLRWEDVDLAGGFVRFRSTKGDEPRSTPMTPRLLEAMREHFRLYRFAQYDGKPSPWVFHHLPRYRTGRSNPGDLVRCGFRGRWERLRDDMGLHGTRRHDLRHRRVTQWVAEGHPISVVGEAVGHSSPQVTAHYTHLDREHLRQLVEPLTGDTKAG